MQGRRTIWPGDTTLFVLWRHVNTSMLLTGLANVFSSTLPTTVDFPPHLFSPEYSASLLYSLYISSEAAFIQYCLAIVSPYISLARKGYLIPMSSSSSIRLAVFLGTIGLLISRLIFPPQTPVLGPFAAVAYFIARLRNRSGSF